MEQNNSVNAMAKIVEILTPLSSEDRARVIRAAMVLLDESKPSLSIPKDETGLSKDINEDSSSLPPRANVWMNQNGLKTDELQEVFHITDAGTEVIAARIPGKNMKEQVCNAYILTGIAQLLLNGNPSFQDKSARALCELSGCYDNGNHSAYIRARGNAFTGTKEKGWTLTAPGLKEGAELIKKLNKKEI